jgi:hypothetical protein
MRLAETLDWKGLRHYKIDKDMTKDVSEGNWNTRTSDFIRVSTR